MPSKSLSLTDASAIIVGSMIGSGIFLAPALIAQIVLDSQLGPGTFISIWIVGGFLTLCGALSYGELAAALPRTGGQYVFLKETYSPLWALLYGWTQFAVIQSGFIAAVALAFANYLGIFIPVISQQNAVLDLAGIRISAVQLAAIGLIVLLTILNARGLREGTLLQNSFTAAKVLALLALVAAGIFSGKGSIAHAQPLLPATLNAAMLGAIAVAMSKALFAYDSWNVVTFVAEQTREPHRTLPRALLAGTLTTTVLYTLTAFVYLYILPIEQAAAVPGQRIAASVAEVLFGGAGVMMISGAILLSTAGCVNGLILSGPWLYHAMARDGLFFRGAAQLDPVHQIPTGSLNRQMIWSILLVLTGSLGTRGNQLYSDLLTFTSFASLLFNALTITGLFILRRNQPELPRPYRVPFYPLTPLLYLTTALFFLVFIAYGDPRNTGIGIGLILLGLPLYWLWRRDKS